MNFPLLQSGSFGLYTGLAVAVLIGIGFGFTLERGGFGSSRRLAAQFYLYDMTVFKVMFTAIVTAMVGLFGLARLGLVDLGAVWINPTFLWPQIVGGFLLGVGFIISGYCPGTAIVASASGKIDGVLALFGVALGILVYGVAYTPSLDAFQRSGAHGTLLLSDLLHVPPIWLAASIVVMAGLAFMGAEKVERIFAGRAEPGRRPSFAPRVRNAVMVSLLAVAFVLALPPARRSAETALRPVALEITPLELARLMVEEREACVPVDLRTPEAFAREAIPGSLRLDRADLNRAETWQEKLPPGRLYIVVDESEAADQTASAGLDVPEGTRVARLRGGFAAWKAEILTEPKAPESALATALEDYRIRAAFFSYFTGAAAAAPAPIPIPAATGGPERKKKPGGGC